MTKKLLSKIVTTTKMKLKTVCSDTHKKKMYKKRPWDVAVE